MKGSSGFMKFIYSFINGMYSPGHRKDPKFYTDKRRKRRSRGGIFKVNQRAELKQSRIRNMNCNAR
jgi:hypothetical protein